MQWRQGDAWAFTSTSQDAVYSQARAANGDQGEIQAAPTNTILRTTRADGGGGAMQTTQYSAMVFQEDSSGTVSRIYTNENEAYLFTRAGGVSRYLTVDADGIWVRTGNSSYNLEETAQDSGWQSITLASGVTGNGNPAWRNKGGVIYFRGNVVSAWNEGWNTVATGLPPEIRPQTRVHIISPGISVNRLIFRVGTDGTLDARADSGVTITGELSGIMYPTG